MSILSTKINYTYINQRFNKNGLAATSAASAIMKPEPTMMEKLHAIRKKHCIVHNVYQLQYKNQPVTGFGDFIRGCLFLLNFGEKYQITIKIHICHPIQEFLKNKTQQVLSLGKDIEFSNDSNVLQFLFHPLSHAIQYPSLNYDIAGFIDELYCKSMHSSDIYIYTIYYPLYQISPPSKQKMVHLLEPNTAVTMQMNQLLSLYNLTPNKFITFHIRMWDHSETIKASEFHFIKQKMKQLLHFSKKKDPLVNIFVISNSLSMKKRLFREFPDLVISNANGIHLGNQTLASNSNSNSNNNKIQDTLVDYHLMSKSAKIVGCSVYDHGSGFSQWCAFIHSIPYCCYLIR